MLKLKHIISSALLVVMPIQVMAAAPNMAPIISYMLSDATSTPWSFDVEAYFEGDTRYYVNAGGSKGERTLNSNDGTYFGMLDIPNVGERTISGNYSVTNNVITFNRTEKGGSTVTETIVLTHTASMPNSNNEVFSVTVNANSAIPTLNFDSQYERDSYEPLSIVTSLTNEAYLIAMSNITPVINSQWYDAEYDNGSLFVYGVLTFTGLNTVTYQEDGEDLETLYYRLVSNPIYGAVIGISETANGTILEYAKFSDVLDQADLAEMFPLITWAAGSQGVINAGADVGESFDAWDGCGDFCTVNYADFGDMITGMTVGNESPNDDSFITGNGYEALYFASGTASTATSGTVVKGDGTTAGSFTIRTVDGETILVVTITDPIFDNDIAFKDIGSEIARGEIYDRWADLMLNEEAKSSLGL